MKPSSNEIGADAVRDALERALASPEFVHAKRLREFLSYVVTETLEGRGEQISGRTIAQDVYGRGKRGRDSDLSVVRVDAGRLRRRLADHYSGSASDALVQIEIPTGSYSPEFRRLETQEASSDVPQPPVRSSSASPFAKAALLGVVALAGYLVVDRFFVSDERVAASLPEDKSAVRRALLRKSPATLQAANQAEQARDLVFPATDPVRLKLVLSLFQHTIDLDGTYFGGYAGAAQVSAIMAALMPDGPQRTGMLTLAEEYSSAALRLRPESSWVQSSAAFVAFANRDYSSAKRLSANAIDLDPDDLHAREVDALIALFTADFERAAKMGDPAKYPDESWRITTRNAYAVAQFYLGNYAEAVNQIETVIENGEPIGEISVFYIVGALWKLGQKDAARDYASYYRTAWPEGRVDQLLVHTFVSADLLDEPTALFRAAGGFEP